jgi:hypothetical protein
MGIDYWGTVWYNTRMNSTTTNARYHAIYTAAIGNFITLLSQATLFDLRAAERWYDEAGAFADSLRPTTGWNMEVACSVVSRSRPA